MRQATGEEGAELDKVVNADTVFLRFSTARVALLGVLWRIV